MALPIDPMEEPRMYQQTLLQDGQYDLLESDMMVDCALKIKDKEFPCHRLVPARTSELSLSQDVEPGVMGMILKYLYTSNINVTEQNVQDIFAPDPLALANMLQIFTICLIARDEEFLQLTPSGVIGSHYRIRHFECKNGAKVDWT
uniref:BTB domain-containing protein n=1 Tax=Cyprinus carpio TaxID=7962 RepID=A0A8C1KDP3_CYPCA